MSNTGTLMLLTFVCTLAAPPGLLGQTDNESARSSVGLRGGYAWTPGEWADSRVAQGVAIFGGGLSFGGDIEFRLSTKLTLALDGGYTIFDGSDWEAYAESKGDHLSVTASMFYAAVLLRPHVKVTGSDRLRLELGPVVVFPDGKETFGGKTYAYDFYGTTRFGGMGGIEYQRLLNEDIAATVRASVIIVPSGVKYADGESRTLIALPVTIGIRFFF